MRDEIKDNVMSTIQSAIADDQIINFSSSFEYYFFDLKINIMSKANGTEAFDQNDEKNLTVFIIFIKMRGDH